MNTAAFRTTTTRPRRVQPAWQRGVGAGTPMGMALLAFIPFLNQLGADPFATAMIATVLALAFGGLMSVVLTKVIARNDHKVAERAAKRGTASPTS